MSQNQLELDLKNKESALGIDTLCHQINNQSRGLQYYSGIEKHDPWYLDPFFFNTFKTNNDQKI